MRPEHDKFCDRGADKCDDQLASIHTAGRGLQGDSYKVIIASDTTDATYLKGMYLDHATGQWTEDWVSENINGGELHRVEYNLRPWTDPMTFTMTFIYKRPGRPEWSWTTPAIPYQFDNAGVNIGSGVADLYIKTTNDPQWKEMLVYPQGTTGVDYNAPQPLDPWTVNLNFGVGGDIEVISLYDLSLLLGISEQSITNIVQGQLGEFAGSDNVKDYVDDLSEHIHLDLGFPTGSLAGDTGHVPSPDWNTVKEYVDWSISQITQVNVTLQNKLNSLTNSYNNLLSLIYGANVAQTQDTTDNPVLGASITPINGDPAFIPTGNMNVYGGSIGASGSRAIKCHDNPLDNDTSTI